MGMTARAMWKADICLDSLRVPVKLFSAIEDTTTHFRLLHKTDLTPVKQQMVDTASKSVVPHDEIQRAVQVERGVFVLVTEEEREEIQPPPSRDIVIRQVVKRTLVDDRWFDRPYFLGPDGDTDSYFALAEALDDEQELAVAQWVMRSEYYAGAVYADQGYLMISTFRNADEMARIDSIRPDPARAPDKRELDLADQLIAALEDTFDPYAFRDEYHERVQDFLRKKAAGKKVTFPKAPRAADKDRSLLESLEASVKQGKRNARGAA
jgi:DNA end-binding protein Ku